MSASSLILPEVYWSRLDLMDTETAIKLVKDTFERELAEALILMRVSAPLYVDKASGLNDNLNGVERPVGFDILEMKNTEYEIVQSLAKWKRLALKRYGFAPGTGLYTDMNALRRDEELDNLHSVYVDQWDWEKVISENARNLDTLKATVKLIYSAIKKTQETVCAEFEELDSFLPEKITFFSAEELLTMYPGCTPKQREDKAAREYGAVFIMQIGGVLSDGKAHDGRAPDYDDWQLNGDILVWYPPLNRSVELSSMGIRVDSESLSRQLETAGCNDRRELPFHKSLLAGELPLTMGGGIGQSRLCLIMLQKAHIGEVQVSAWPEDMAAICEAHGICLL